MSTDSSAFSKAKAIKQILLATPLGKLLKSYVRFALASIVKIVYWAPLLSSKHIREACFDSARPNTLMLSNVGEERYLISSSDSIIGRNVFIGGGFEFKKFEKVLSLLDNSFERKLLVDIGANIGTICIPAIKR